MEMINELRRYFILDNKLIKDQINVQVNFIVKYGSNKRQDMLIILLFLNKIKFINFR